MAPAELAAPRPVRMPKLKYRNPLPADQSSLSSHTSASGSLSTSPEDHFPYTPPSITPPSSSSSSRPSFDSRSVASSSLASNASSSQDSKAPKKKKGNGVFGFLTLKEPSQLAFEQYADQQRKQAAERGGPGSGSGTPVGGLPGVTTQRLPAGVPKVNSKWDGLPEAVKNRDSVSIRNRSSTTSHTSRSSSSSSKSSRLTSRQSTWTTPTPAPTLASMESYSSFSVATEASRGPPNSLASTSRLNVNDEADDRRDSGPSFSDLPEMTYFFPDAVDTSTLPHNQQPAPKDPDSPVDFLDDASTPEPGTPVDDSPSSSSTTVDAAASVIFKKLTGHQGLLGSDEKEMELNNGLADSHDFLFGPQSTPKRIFTGPIPRGAPAIDSAPHSPALNFSRPLSVQTPPRMHSPTPQSPQPEWIPPLQSNQYQHMQPQPGQPPFVPPQRVQSHQLQPQHIQPLRLAPAPAPPPPAISRFGHQYRPSAGALPTLYEASIASSDTTEQSDQETIGRKSYEESIAESIAPSIAPSVAPSIAPSVAPSEMSASWYESPRERLGLGGRLRKSDVMPWEKTSDKKRDRGKPKKGRFSMPLLSSKSHS